MIEAATQKDDGAYSGVFSMQSLLENLPGLAYRTRSDNARQPAFVSAGCRGLTGYPPDAFVNGEVDLMQQVVHPDDRARVNDVIEHAIVEDERYAITYRIVTKSGSVRWVREQGCVVRLPSQLPPSRGVLEGIIIDVTDVEESRASLEEERTRFADAQRLARVGSWTYDHRTRATTATDEIYHILGVALGTQVDLLEYFWSMLSPSARARSRGILATNRQPHTESEWTITRADGSVRHVFNRTEWTFDADGMVVVGRGTMQDITDRVAAQQQLAHSESRFQSLVQASAQVVWHADAEGMPLDDLAAYLAFTGIEPRAGARARDVWMDAVHPDDREALAENFRDAYTRNVPFDVTHRLRRRDGEWRQVHGRGVPVMDATGVVREWVGTITDVTEFWRAEEAARLAQAQQVALLQSIPESAWLKGLDGCYITVNSAYARRIGLTEPNEMIGRHANEFFPAAAVQTFEEEERNVLEQGEVQTFVSSIELGEGNRRTFETTIAPYRDASGSVAGTVGVSRDVTERRLIQERLVRSQKVEALGMLSGGIAHDFNNLLSAIIGGAELARMELPDGTQAAEDIDEVRRAAVRGAGLTRQLLTFSRNQVVQIRPIDLAAVVRDAEPLLKRLLPESIGLDLDTDAVCVVKGDVSQFEQVVVNLVVNARDALKGTGRVGLISVCVERESLAAGDARLERRDATPLPDGAYIALTVRDNGIGMDAATLGRMFDPFFTTKRAGEGTGLGLATVSSVIAQRGGTVHVASTLGEGTTFTVLLPASDLAPDHMISMPTELPTGTETVLLVEDEAVVRVTARRILERYGYTVLEARHGEDALLLWREQRDGIRLIVTDLRMPELGGRELVERVHGEQPDLPIVFMSGYANTNELPDAGELARSVFLPKPFTTESLLTSVRDALDSTVNGTTELRRTPLHNTAVR